MPAPNPPFKTILELVLCNGCRCIAPDVINVIKITSFQYFLYIREQKKVIGARSDEKAGCSNTVICLVATSSNHTKAFVQCCHGKYTVASSQTLLSSHVPDGTERILDSLFVNISETGTTVHDAGVLTPFSTTQVGFSFFLIKWQYRYSGKTPYCVHYKRLGQINVIKVVIQKHPKIRHTKAMPHILLIRHACHIQLTHRLGCIGFAANNH